LLRYEESDAIHSTPSEEWIKIIGTAVVNGVPTIITLIYTMRSNNTIIRIITTRKSTREEQEKYENN